MKNQKRTRKNILSTDDEQIWRMVVIKFKKPFFSYEDNVDKYFEAFDKELKKQWDSLADSFKGIELQRLFSIEPSEVKELPPEAMNFLSFFAIIAPPDLDPDALNEKLTDSNWDSLEYSYVASGPAPAPARPTGANPLYWDGVNITMQHYLEPVTPMPGHTHFAGINVTFAWDQTGGDGKGMTWIDVEQGWKLDHEDLQLPATTLVHGVNRNIPMAGGLTTRQHGTAVLGIVAARDNDKGIVGIAYKAKTKVVSGWETKPRLQLNWADAIWIAANALTPGDVILLEAQTSLLLPIELEGAVLTAIQYATIYKKLIVVEAAGNAGVSLDGCRFGVSGAILVGAATATGTNKGKRINSSNYGTRVDCFAWGNFVETTMTDTTAVANNIYTPNFSGTSSASAIVAGVALVVQGLAKAHGAGTNPNGTYTSGQLRNILRSHGTPSGRPATDLIGMMPDLEEIIGSELGL